MRYAIVDTECSTYAKGNCYAERNKLCLVGLRVCDTDGSGERSSKNYIWKIEYDEAPYAEALGAISALLATLDTCVVFNGKFDLGWLARYGVDLPDHCRIFDCQLAEFILSYQQTPFPSLDGCLAKYGLGSKLHTVEHEYWALGIDTPEIPYDILEAYLLTDLEKTDALYQALLPLCEHQRPLINLHMQDLRVLQEMEQHGLFFSWAAMEQEAVKVQERLDAINHTILSFVPEDFRSHFNSASGDHLSTLLYGGSVSVHIGTPYQHTYKSGAQSGETATRYRWETRRFELSRLVTPPESSELKKEGFFSVDEETLRTIHSSKETKELIAALLSRSELEKLLGTYYHGIVSTAQKYDWQDGYVHGTLNQCRVVTGRLSAEKPNQQNFPPELGQFIISRYE
jgi:DNA polymerase I-like protein with 3'-5' exonuclease and polymerase domains